MFVVKAAPAPGLEQFGKIFEPLLGKGAPPRHNIAASCRARLMCHDPARQKRDAKATKTNQLKRETSIFWESLRKCSKFALALQLPFRKASESMGNHDSEIVDAGSVD